MDFDIETRKVEAKKKFGQNFLKDLRVIEKIIQSIPESSSKIVEIGAGLGDLTLKLLDVRDVLSYEIDEDLCKILKQRFKHEIDEAKLTLRCMDALESQGSFFEANYVLVANLPYYVATNIILTALRDRHCETILVMVQKEVAQKFCALPGDRNYGAISVIAELSGEREYLFDVGPECFDPAPKVTSAVFTIRKKASLQEEKFFKFLKAAFNAPRKKLSSNLSAVAPKESIETFLETQNLAKDSRPHQISAALYLSMFENIYKDKDHGKPRKQ